MYEKFSQRKRKDSLVFLIVFGGCSLFTSLSEAQNYTYEEVLRITNARGGSEVLINYPKFMALDHEGNIYVADYQLPAIHKFNKEGEIVAQIGGRGRGPGEFTEVSAMFFDPSNRTVVVYDRMNLRLTRFSPEGELLETQEFPGEQMVSPWMGRANENGEIFLLYREFPLPNEPPPEVDDLVHVYNPEFTEKTASLVQSSTFGDVEESYFANRIVGGPRTGFFELVTGNELVAVPYIYTGEIYHYEKTDEEWRLKNTLVGETVVEKFYEQIEHSTAPDYAVKMGTPRGAVAGLIYSESAGICIIDGEKLVVFTYQKDDSYIGEFGYSLFDLQTGEFLGYGKMDDLSPDSLDPSHSVLHFSYHDGHFYFVDYRGEEPEIVVARIEFDVP